MTTPLTPGDTVGRLIVLEEAGRGARGVVYKSYDPRLERTIALKLMLPRTGAGASDRSRKRLVKEAQAMAQLTHPNVVTVHNVTTAKIGSTPHVLIEMEYVGGRSLREWIDDEAAQHRVARRGWKTIVDIFLQAGEGLAAAHQRQLVHRDFKPANVLVDADGRAMVTDFGLVRRASGSSTDQDGDRPTVGPAALDVPLTETGMWLGTPAYMAPEQFDGRDGTAASDQFAFCVALHEALFGVRPFRGATVAELIEALDRPPVPTGASSVPRFVRRALARGLCRDPAERFPSMTALLAALRADPGARWRTAAVVTGATATLAAGGFAVASWLEPGQLSLTVRPWHDDWPATIEIDGTRYAIDERSDGEARLNVDLAAGVHRLVVHAPDHDRHEQLFELDRDQVREIEIPLQHEQGSISLDTRPVGARLTLDEQEFGSTMKERKIDTGRHLLRIRQPGRHEVRLSVDVKHEQSLALTAYLDRAVTFQHLGAGLHHDHGLLGDFDHDGMPDIWDRNYATVTAYSPHRGTRLWSHTLSSDDEAAFVRMVDVDHDGIVDLIGLGVGDEGPRLDVLRKDAPWSFEPPAATATKAPRVPPVIVDNDGKAVIVVASMERGVVTALDALDGESLWSHALPEPVFGLVAGRDALGPWVAAAHREGVTMLDATVLDARGPTRERWSRPISSFDSNLIAGLDDGHRLTRRGRERGESWMVSAPLDDQPGDDLALVAAVDPGGGPLRVYSGLSGDARPDGLRVHPLTLGRLDDLNGDGIPELLAQPRPTTRTSVHLLETGELPLAIISGATGTPLDRLAPREHVGPWPCGGPPRIIRRTTERLEVRPLGRKQPAEPSLALASDQAHLCADWTGDGRPETIVTTTGGELRAFAVDEDGSMQEVGATMLPRAISDTVPLGDIDGDARPDFLLAAGGPTVVRGSRIRWGRAMGSRMRAPPVVADFDGDGATELALFDGEQDMASLFILSARDGRTLHNPTDSGFAIRQPIAVAGDTDNTTDLLFASSMRITRWSGSDASFHDLPIPSRETYAGLALSADPTTLWRAPWTEGPGLQGFEWVGGGAGGHWRQLVRFGQAIDGRIRPRVLNATERHPQQIAAVVDGGRLVLLDRTNTKCQWSRWVATTPPRWGPTAFDLDTDGEAELITPLAPDAATAPDECTAEPGTRPADTSSLAAVTRAGVVRWTRAELGRAVAPPTGVDDGTMRWLVGATEAGLYALSADGSTRWLRPLPNPAVTPVRTGDLNGDGRAEAVVATSDGRVFVVDAASGAMRWQWRPPEGDFVELPVVIEDLDDDGRSELIVVTQLGFVFVLDGTFVADPAAR